MYNSTISKQECTPKNVIHVLDAVIERIISSENIRHVVISYMIMDENFMIHKKYIALVIGPKTIIRDPYGDKFSFKDLSLGMIVDADFSSIMTKSIPPQSRAFKIIVSYKNWPFNVKIDKVLQIDIKNRFLYTGNSDDIYSQMRFVITNSTQILDKTGNKIKLEDLMPGQLVRIAYAVFMTLSIPPQTTAFRVQLLNNINLY